MDLGFDVDTLRIVDLDEDDDDNNNYTNAGGGNSNSTSVLDNIKRGNAAKTVSEDPSDGATATSGKIRAQTDSTKLRDFLNNLGDEE
jgi:hypothetical protein